MQNAPHVTFLPSLGLTFSILLIEWSDVKGVGSIYLSPRRDQRRRIFLLINLVPIDSTEECVVLQLFGATTSTSETLIHITLEREHEYIYSFSKFRLNYVGNSVPAVALPTIAATQQRRCLATLRSSWESSDRFRACPWSKRKIFNVSNTPFPQVIRIDTGQKK